MSPKSTTRTAVSYFVNTFSAPAVMSITHFSSTLFYGYFRDTSIIGVYSTMAFPHSRMGMMPLPEVRVFQPKICSSCSPNVATSSPVFSRISGSSVNDKSTLYHESGPSTEGSHAGKLANRTLRYARTAING